jgi:gamma-glutamyltranspeptidase/glutathione hydrolase
MRARGALLAMLAGASLAGRPAAPNDLIARGSKGAVVSAHPLATQVGLDVLRAGGNAIDAAVATFLALAVVHPQAGNLGGGGFLLVRMADGRTLALDFRECAPAAAHRDMYLRADGSVDEDRSRYGALAAGVPGSPAGLVAVLDAFGSKPLLELAAPAIALARAGFVVDHFLADDLAEARPLLARFPSSAEVFLPGGTPPGIGARLVQRDLAATLERFASEGNAGFYAGETARRIVAQMQASGGLITAADLAAYAPRARAPLRGRYRGHEILAMPPPSSGGVGLLQMLNLLEPYDLASLGFGSSRALHLTAEAMRRAYADRARWLGDSDFQPVPVDGLVGKEYAETLRASLRTDRVSDVAPGRPPGAPEGDHTTHLSVVDAAGNAVACTTTINSSFGCGLVVEGAGFLLNNEMDDFSAKPGVPNQFGLLGGTANAIEPGKRMLSSMTPTIVVHQDRVRLVLGSPGGGRIINTVLQVLLNVLDYGMQLPAAVAAPRVHHQWRPDLLYAEPLAVPADVRANLEQLGHRLAPFASIGRCQAIAVEPDGTRTAAADPRSGGAAAAY